MKLPLLLVLLTSTAPATAQILHNLGFSDTCAQSKTGLCHWTQSWGPANSIRPGADRTLLIEVENNVGFTEQIATWAGPPLLRVIRFSGKIKSENVAGKGAGLNIGIYDAEGNLLTTKDMGYLPSAWVLGTRDWKTYTLEAVWPAEAREIRIGAILYGSGRAWFDDFRVSFENVQNREASRVARNYIQRAFDTIAAHSLRRDSVDLEAIKQTALSIAGPAQLPADCHLALAYALQMLGDHHSFFMDPQTVRGWASDTTVAANAKAPNCRVIKDMGYIYVPGFHGGQAQRMRAFADTIQAGIRRLARSGIKGWIVDLRHNDGGNMQPMIAGLGPLFSAKKLGYLIDIDGNRESWGYRDGAYFWENEKIAEVSNPVVLTKKLPIAVLIGPQVGSSGEIVAISFIGNDQTRLFGQSTWGLTTGNGSYDLPDGARMMLASTIMADRFGKRYLGPVEPDERVGRTGQENYDVDLDAALEWLRRQR